MNELGSQRARRVRAYVEVDLSVSEIRFQCRVESLNDMQVSCRKPSAKTRQNFRQQCEMGNDRKADDHTSADAKLKLIDLFADPSYLVEDRDCTPDECISHRCNDHPVGPSLKQRYAQFTFKFAQTSR